MLRQQAGESGSVNIEQLQNVALNVMDGVCSIVTRPLDLILRPQFGTRYFSPPAVFFSTILMVVLPALSAVTHGIEQMIPGHGLHPPVGLFGLGSLSKLYFLLSFIHGIRLWTRMLHPERELISDFEGPPLPFFQLFPKSDSFWITRILWEPVFVLVAATILGRVFVFQYGLTLYCQIAALMLSMKSFLTWFRGWEYLRILLDMKFTGPIIAKMLENRATTEEMAAIHLAGFPTGLSPEMRRAALTHIARVVSDDDQKTGQTR
jgi:hypothetical protein